MFAHQYQINTARTPSATAPQTRGIAHGRLERTTRASRLPTPMPCRREGLPRCTTHQSPSSTSCEQFLDGEDSDRRRMSRQCATPEDILSVRITAAFCARRLWRGLLNRARHLSHTDARRCRVAAASRLTPTDVAPARRYCASRTLALRTFVDLVGGTCFLPWAPFGRDGPPSASSRGRLDRTKSNAPAAPLSRVVVSARIPCSRTLSRNPGQVEPQTEAD